MSDFTEQAIMEAFVELLEEKPFNKITVKDIVGRCGINRNTFYYHYQDIYDLLEKVIRYYLEASNIKNLSRENWKETTDTIVQFVGSHKHAMAHVFDFIGAKELCHYFREVSWQAIEHYMEPVFTTLNAPEEDREFFLRLMSNSVVGTIMEWAEHDFNKAFADRVIERLAYWLTGSLNMIDYWRN
ncbi:TetR/AcrR family transcriptional regulator [Catenisphaera adipataccumulans]|uniref:AcrR family transcriptional regulator n=1 Tax=Catenisphaera adipataccumulans TaxID=700500 RepID=A0A7W8CZF7_9FIRM|nr:TetR/AcrR family transcriptional regulator [Catenisphaera adipataccumulans]MBB5183167.1 AcrR family transcriptional regulator [Catenisphaera adipataccumulans]